MGEYYYRGGEQTVGQVLSDLHKAATWFPLERRFRVGAALVLGNLAMARSEREFKVVAIPELQAALARDPTQADLLVMIVTIERALGQEPEARYMDMLRRIDRPQ
jgi:hypothetical protein